MGLIRRRLSGAAALTLAACLMAPGCSRTPDERRQEIYERQRVGSADDIAWIRIQLSDPSPEVRATAIHALVQLKVHDAVELALQGLADGSGFVRKIAAKCLEDLADPTGRDALESTMLEDSDPRVRRAAADALVAVGRVESLPALVRALDDPDKKVRLSAVRGVIRLAPEQAVEPLATLLLADPEWEVRVQAAAGLGRTGRPDLRPVLEQAVHDPNEFVRAAVAKALDSLE